jgi:hypothetical protein
LSRIAASFGRSAEQPQYAIARTAAVTALRLAQRVDI